MWIIILSVQHCIFPCEFAFKTKVRDAPWNEKLRILKVRRYVAHLIDLNGYLNSFPGATLADKIDVTEFNKIMLNSTPDSCSKQAYVQGFDCKSTFFKKYVNMFECMEIAEYI